MIANKDITVINEADGIYFGTYIRGVSCIGKTARTATENGLVSADYFTIRIPKASGEIPALLPQKTMIAIGEVKDADLKDIKSFLRTHKVYSVVSVGDNRHGSPAVRHWRIDCK